MQRLYIAYGSNLNLEQMSRRCPGAKPYSRGYLMNWELIYRGSKTGAYLSIRKKQGAMTPVLLWKITRMDEWNLDLYEGYPTFYYKDEVMVDTALYGKKKGMVYIMDPKRKPGIPSQSYVDTVAYGYLDNDFDLQYLRDSIKLNAEEMGIKKSARR